MKNKTCWRINLINNKALCFIDSDEDVFYQNELYISGNHPSSISSSNELGEDGFSISGLVDENIEFMSNAYIEVFLLDLNSLSKVILKTGWLDEIKYDQHKFTAKIRSLSSKCNNLIGNCYSSSCRAEFGDSLCKVEFEKYSGSVTAIIGSNSFIDLNRLESDDYFINGIVEFQNGLKYNVKEHRDKKITLDAVLKVAIDTRYSITVGCNKSLHCCVNKFNNAINFRGEPFIPNSQKLVAR